jgi:hypothetical protein
MILVVACCSFILHVPLCPAQSENLKALLIGNSDYTKRNGFEGLNGTPYRDIEAIRDELIRAGFIGANITALKDLSSAKMLQQLDTFGSHLRADDGAIFYFSGHGFSLNHIDYLAPIDATLRTAASSGKVNAISVPEILSNLRKAKIRVVVIDACRLDLKRQLKGPTGKRKLISNMEGTRMGTGELEAYAASPGQAALASSSGGLSSYTSYLIKSFAKKPQTFLQALNEAKALSWNDRLDDSSRPQIVDSTTGPLYLPAYDLDLRQAAEGTARDLNANRVADGLIETPFSDRRPRCPASGSLSSGWSIDITSPSPLTAQKVGYNVFTMRTDAKNRRLVDMDRDLYGALEPSLMISLASGGPLYQEMERMSQEAEGLMPNPGFVTKIGIETAVHPVLSKIQYTRQESNQIVITYRLQSGLNVTMREGSIPLDLMNFTEESRATIEAIDVEGQKAFDGRCLMLLRDLRGYKALENNIYGVISKFQVLDQEESDHGESARYVFHGMPDDQNSQHRTEADVKSRWQSQLDARIDYYNEVNPSQQSKNGDGLLPSIRSAAADFLEWNREQRASDSKSFAKANQDALEKLGSGKETLPRDNGFSPLIEYLENLLKQISVLRQ